MSGRPAEEFDRTSCRDCLYNYYLECFRYAELNDGAFPNVIPEKKSSTAKYGSDHYEYYGAGKSAASLEPFILLQDKDNNHIGNCRFAIRSDGVIMISKFGRKQYDVYENAPQAAADRK
jgi:hypothetical protein